MRRTSSCLLQSTNFDSDDGQLQLDCVEHNLGIDVDVDHCAAKHNNLGKN